MEETKKPTKRRKIPIKTEWNSRCVLFTYFQGDISSVVDEHFSRALKNVKKPSSQSQYVTTRNESGMPPNQWRVPSQWRKLQPEAAVASGGANRNSNMYGPMAMELYRRSLTRGPTSIVTATATATATATLRDMWHFSSLANLNSLERGYPHAFSGGHVVPEPKPDGKGESFLSLLQQERCPGCPPESARKEDQHNYPQTSGRAGLFFDPPPGPSHCLSPRNEDQHNHPQSAGRAGLFFDPPPGPSHCKDPSTDTGKIPSD
ncbi:transcription cofactor vestigial-like protein 1 [Tenrec ecaudatus]|uniref:transcription cofactor vestigial-like protein 1 n=1 Tax=Tenrec ecaudatus TaxID=94439 RepID=UPI003F5A09F8